MLCAGLAQHSISWLVGLILAMNTCTALQDIAVDGLAIDHAGDMSVSLVNAVQIVGFKLGILVGGGGLALVTHALGLGHAASFYCMAAIVAAVLVLCVLPVRERAAHGTEGDASPSSPSTLTAAPPSSASSPSPPSASSSSRPAARSPSEDASFWRTIVSIAESCRQPEVLVMLLYIATYKSGEVMADTMFKPFLVDRGFALLDISRWSGVYGMLSSIAGSLLGGLLTQGSGRTWLFLAAAANVLPQLLRALLVLDPQPQPWAVIAVICLEAFSGGALTTRVFTWMMLQSQTEFSASHFTFFATVEMTGKFVAQVLSGFVANYFGYAAMFLLGAAMTLGSVVVLLRSPISDGGVTGKEKAQ